jgi:ATPase subunit of ABC transporter with duplicated ATPase domains
MAKRRHDEEDEEEEEELLSDEEEEEAPTQKKRARTGVKGAQQDYEELVAMDKQQEADTAKLAKRMKTGGAGSTQGGLIKAVYLENFLCHSRLSFTFGPQMNFIIGHNGSGKSAVLTALVVVLGGKSNSTGRGNGVKDFVKSGTDKALIRVTLRNDGMDPFKHEEFGDSIDIERSITKEGQTQYKIKGQRGQKALTGKQARTNLGQILDHFDIQVDNPMTVLNQDQSRHFLANADEGKKYGVSCWLEGQVKVD